MIALVCTKNINAISAPGGWTQIAQNNVSGFSGAIFWKLSNGAESNPTFSWTNSNGCIAVVHTFQATTTSVQIGVVGTLTASSGGTHSSASITASADNGLAIYADICANNTALTTPSGWVSIADLGANACRLSVGSKALPTTGTTTGAISTTGGTGTLDEVQIEIKASSWKLPGPPRTRFEARR